jgi:hypothetical protein
MPEMRFSSQGTIVGHYLFVGLNFDAKFEVLNETENILEIIFDARPVSLDVRPVFLRFLCRGSNSRKLIAERREDFLCEMMQSVTRKTKVFFPNLKPTTG